MTTSTDATSISKIGIAPFLVAFPDSSWIGGARITYTGNARFPNNPNTWYRVSHLCGGTPRSSHARLRGSHIALLGRNGIFNVPFAGPHAVTDLHMDLDDQASLGCLRALVRLVWAGSDPPHFGIPSDMAKIHAVPERGGWVVVYECGTRLRGVPSGVTEAEALYLAAVHLRLPQSEALTALYRQHESEGETKAPKVQRW